MPDVFGSGPFGSTPFGSPTAVTVSPSTISLTTTIPSVAPVAHASISRPTITNRASLPGIVIAGGGSVSLSPSTIFAFGNIPEFVGFGTAPFGTSPFGVGIASGTTVFTSNAINKPVVVAVATIPLPIVIAIGTQVPGPISAIPSPPSTGAYVSFPTTITFDEALRNGHGQVEIRATVFDSGVAVAEVELIDGEVQIDANGANRRSFRGTVLDPAGDLVPRSMNDLLAASGNELFIERGIRFDDGTLQMFPLGVFAISAVTGKFGPHGEIEVVGLDRAQKVRRSRHIRPYVVLSGTNYATAIRDMLTSRVPTLQFNFASTTRLTPALVWGEQTDNDPWRDAQEMATAIGYDLFFDAQGVCVLRPAVDADTAPIVAEYVEGWNSTVLDGEREFEGDASYNGVIATGQSSSATSPVRAEVWDTNPESPTYAGNPIGTSKFGAIPFFFASPLLTTDSAALAAANSILLKVVGGNERIRLSAIPDPRRDVDEGIRVFSHGAKVDGTYVTDTVSIPISIAGSMGLSVRKRRVN